VFPVSSPPYEILDVWIYIFLPLNKEDFGFDDFSSHLRMGIGYDAVPRRFAKCCVLNHCKAQITQSLHTLGVSAHVVFDYLKLLFTSLKKFVKQIESYRLIIFVLCFNIYNSPPRSKACVIFIEMFFNILITRFKVIALCSPEMTKTVWRAGSYDLAPHCS
jgi:hypothetical protein